VGAGLVTTLITRTAGGTADEELQQCRESEQRKSARTSTSWNAEASYWFIHGGFWI
jgi:hypothetical protein